MKLPVLTAKRLNEMAPCHDTGLYSKDWGGTAIDAIEQWSGKGCSHANVMWCILRTEFIPEELLHRFSLDIARNFGSLKYFDAISAKELWLDGEITQDDLEVERELLKQKEKNLEDNHNLYARRLYERTTSNQQTVALKRKVDNSKVAWDICTITRICTGPSPRACTLGAFQKLTTEDQHWASARLREMLVEYQDSDSDEQPKSWFKKVFG